MNNKYRIRAENLHAGYGTQEIIQSISCSFTEGTFTGIIGPNGSGKTTLLRAISRALPSTGILELDGKPVAEYTHAELGMTLGYVPQDEERPFSYTVLQVVLMARYTWSSRFTTHHQADYACCHAALEDTGIIHLKDRSIRSLSGGEWQRVLIARALAQEPKVLLLDEPTSHLDFSHQTEILSLMRNLASSGSTIIGVFHDLNLAALYCDRIIMIRNGQIIADDTPSQVLTPEKIREVYNADVLISVHPATGRIFLHPTSSSMGRSLPTKSLSVLVISGGGTGTDLLQFLSRNGFPVTAGILATTDSDYLTVQALKIPCIPVSPFSRIPADSLEKLRNTISCSDHIILSMHPIGAGNLPVLNVLLETDPTRIIIHLPDHQDFSSYDFTRGAATGVMADLCAAGASCTNTFKGILVLMDRAWTGKPSPRSNPR